MRKNSRRGRINPKKARVDLELIFWGLFSAIIIKVAEKYGIYDLDLYIGYVLVFVLRIGIAVAVVELLKLVYLMITE